MHGLAGAAYDNAQENTLVLLASLPDYSTVHREPSVQWGHRCNSSQAFLSPPHGFFIFPFRPSRILPEFIDGLPHSVS